MTFKKIKIVTDSSCDIPQHLLDQWGIIVIPVYVHIGDESFADDGTELDRTDYYDRLVGLNPLPTTSAPSPGLCEQMLDKALVDVTKPTAGPATMTELQAAQGEAQASELNEPAASLAGMRPWLAWTLLGSFVLTLIGIGFLRTRYDFARKPSENAA